MHVCVQVSNFVFFCVTLLVESVLTPIVRAHSPISSSFLLPMAGMANILVIWAMQLRMRRIITVLTHEDMRAWNDAYAQVIKAPGATEALQRIAVLVAGCPCEPGATLRQGGTWHATDGTASPSPRAPASLVPSGWRAWFGVPCGAWGKISAWARRRPQPLHQTGAPVSSEGPSTLDSFYLQAQMLLPLVSCLQQSWVEGSGGLVPVRWVEQDKLDDVSTHVRSDSGVRDGVPHRPEADASLTTAGPCFSPDTADTVVGAGPSHSDVEAPSEKSAAGAMPSEVVSGHDDGRWVAMSHAVSRRVGPWLAGEQGQRKRPGNEAAAAGERSWGLERWTDVKLRRETGGLDAHVTWARLKKVGETGEGKVGETGEGRVRADREA